jgi:beta-galactosidase
MKLNFSVLMLCLFMTSCIHKNQDKISPRQTIILKKGWTFNKGKFPEAIQPDYDDSDWKKVSVPHDWAIYGPFDKEIDKQVIAITQNNETEASEKTGRTGALPYIGEGWYRNNFSVPNYDAGKKIILQFEGAMSEPEVFLNGEKIGEWKYGYAYFYFDISDKVKAKNNNLVVKLTNREKSSRWYPGAGLFRKVSLIVKDKQHIKHWGNYITTPKVSTNFANINIKTQVVGQNLKLITQIFSKDGELITSLKTEDLINETFYQNINIENPELWSPERPYLYSAMISLYSNGKLVDQTEEKIGIRSIDYNPENGFSLNGKVRKFKGVCLHHDLGPLGAAVNKSAIRRRLKILKDMGADAIRSAHNMPSFEILELADEMGFMFLAESFDEWKKPKVENGYHLYFDDYAEKDIVNLVRATRNHPSIVMWSSGNEVPDQWGKEGVIRAKWLQDVFHREDPTRPVTVGMDQVEAVMENGFGAVMDVPGLNYRVHLYEKAHETFPQGFLLGSETASTVSSRGVYKFPVKKGSMVQYEDYQSSSYDLEHCSWSNFPDDDFILQDDKPWVIGEFVWTGFDYLGEPTPYDEVWPSRSSYFGISDLAGIPKDRYYLYRSRWNTKEETLHILPHWNWKGREGKNTPVFVYTNYETAELFINGKSQGIRRKNDSTPQHRYRLMWKNVKYEPGELKVIALDDNEIPIAEKKVLTADQPYKIVMESDRKLINADGEDLAFITVSVVDKNGNPCPTANNNLEFSVKGKGKFKAVCSGDPTSLEMFHEPKMKLFSGKLVVIVQSGLEAGDLELNAKGIGLKPGKIIIETSS